MISVGSWTPVASVDVALASSTHTGAAASSRSRADAEGIVATGASLNLGLELVP